MLDRLELLLIQITELEKSRDAVLEDANPDKAASMIQQLAKLRGVGVQSATVLVREGFVREFANGKALGSYAGLTSTPYSRCKFARNNDPLRGDFASNSNPS
jgi:transposase